MLTERSQGVNPGPGGSRAFARARLLAADGRAVTSLDLSDRPRTEWALQFGEVYIEGLAAGSYRVIVATDDDRRWTATAIV